MTVIVHQRLARAVITVVVLMTAVLALPSRAADALELGQVSETTTVGCGYDLSANLAPATVADARGSGAAEWPAAGATGPSLALSSGLVAPRPIADISDDVLRNLPASQQRAVRSLQQQIVEHQAKLEAYRANPYAYDNLGILRDAPTDAIRQSIIDGRIRHLQHEINTFADQIRKLAGG